MSRWLALAREAQKKTEPLTGKPAKTGRKEPVASRMGLLPVPAGLPVGVSKLDTPLVEHPITADQGQKSVNPPDTDADSPYVRSVGGSPRTWTGKVVSLADWRNLSEWERHGSTGKVWNGNTQQWEPKT